MIGYEIKRDEGSFCVSGRREFGDNQTHRQVVKFGEVGKLTWGANGTFEVNLGKRGSMGLLKKKSKTSWWKSAALVAGAIGVATLCWPNSATAEDPVESQDSAEADAGGFEQLRVARTDVEQFNQGRIDRNRQAMAVLFGWAVTNMAVGIPGALTTDGRRQHFFEMTAAWNVVNAAIAGFGYVNSGREDAAAGDLIGSLSRAHSLEKVLLFNMGLNVAYIATGGYLWERGIRTDSDRLRGYGPAMMIQGGFLLGFDSILFATSRRDRRSFEGWLMPVDDGMGATVQMRF